jgi:hypothetical protein
MPAVNWATEPFAVVSDFATRHNRPEHAGLILHGVWAVDGLHYLTELDLADDLSTDTVRGYPPDRVDVAHVRWATGTCVTALDLCAAGIGRILCGHIKPKELDVTHFAASHNGSAKHRAVLPGLMLTWFDDLLKDADYVKVKDVRNALTHGLIRRHFKMPRQRLDIQVGDVRLSVPQIIAISRDTAQTQISRLLDILPTI